MAHLTDIIHKQSPCADERIIKVYVRTRTFIRIRYLYAAFAALRMKKTTKIKQFEKAAKL